MHEFNCCEFFISIYEAAVAVAPAQAGAGQNPPHRPLAAGCTASHQLWFAMKDAPGVVQGELTRLVLVTCALLHGSKPAAADDAATD